MNILSIVGKQRVSSKGVREARDIAIVSCLTAVTALPKGAKLESRTFAKQMLTPEFASARRPPA